VTGFDFPVVASLACSGAFFVLAAAVAIVRRPQSPQVLPAMSDLGPETPAVANLLANGGRITPDAVPATLLDLAARRVVKIEDADGDTYACRLGSQSPGALTAYESRVLALLRRKAEGGVVPARALTAGPADEAKGWMKAFRREVVAEANRAGKCAPRWPPRVVGALGLLTLGAFLLAAAGGESDSLTGPQAIAIGFAILTSVVLTYAFTEEAQMVTPSGIASQARWLALRQYLRDDELFPSLPPTAVVVRERYLAYGAALGVAVTAVRAIPMGAESDRWAWSRYSGEWRRVEVSYSGAWPVPWGNSPWRVGLTGAWIGAFGVFWLWVASLFLPSLEFGPKAEPVTRYFSIGAVAVGLAALAAVVVAIVFLCTAVVAQLRTTTVTGEAIRVRRFGSDEDRESSCYLAVYTGTGDRVRAWVVRPELYPALREYSTVTVSVAPLVGYVRSVHAAAPPVASPRPKATTTA
jgi:hypothetical protein